MTYVIRRADCAFRVLAVDVVAAGQVPIRHGTRERRSSIPPRRLAGRNTRIDDRPCFLGAGGYRHFVPATVDYVLQRGEFYTA